MLLFYLFFRASAPLLILIVFLLHGQMQSHALQYIVYIFELGVFSVVVRAKKRNAVFCVSCECIVSDSIDWGFNWNAAHKTAHKWLTKTIDLGHSNSMYEQKEKKENLKMRSIWRRYVSFLLGKNGQAPLLSQTWNCFGVSPSIQHRFWMQNRMCIELTEWSE